MMPNEENLIPLNRRTKGERRKIATMAELPAERLDAPVKLQSNAQKYTCPCPCPICVSGTK